MPRKPGKEKDQDRSGQGNTKVARAVSLVQGGKRPMKGIRLLKEVLEKNPSNAEALWHLGKFSMKTGQYEKALERFEKVLKVAPEQYPDAHLYVGRLYGTLGEPDKGIGILKEYRGKTQEDTLIPYINELIRKIRQETSKNEFNAKWKKEKEI